MNWASKTVLITGASSGIGEALAREFARQGATLVLLARREERLQLIAESLKPATVYYYPCDVCKDEDLPRILASLKEKGIRLDVVVANAGFGVMGAVMDLSLEDYRRQFETNLFGVLRTIQATVPELKKTRGRLAIIGSVNGYVTLPSNSPYAMSKFAVRALATSLRFELAESGVSVTHIAPGFVVSEIRKIDNEGQLKVQGKDPIPMWLQMPAETAAKKIAKAIYRRKSERIVTAHGYWIVFFSRHFPKLLNALIQISGVKARLQKE
jgi:short-subunit dehydrogenase